MTDEELGRAWAQRHGTRLNYYDDTTGANVTDGYRWQDESDDGFLHPAVRVFLDADDFMDEADAHDHLGVAIRRVVAFADGVKEVMG